MLKEIGICAGLALIVIAVPLGSILSPVLYKRIQRLRRLYSAASAAT